jgi:Zn-dependent M16 (insulinase) family peptidase
MVFDEFYIRGITREAIQGERNEVLGTNAETIKGYAPLIDDIVKQDCFCVLGNEGKIKENRELFKNIVNVVE